MELKFEMKKPNIRLILIMGNIFVSYLSFIMGQRTLSYIMTKFTVNQWLLGLDFQKIYTSSRINQSIAYIIFILLILFSVYSACYIAIILFNHKFWGTYLMEGPKLRKSIWSKEMTWFHSNLCYFTKSTNYKQKPTFHL